MSSIATVLGVRQIDMVNHKVVIQFGDARLDRCEGTLPTPDGAVHLQWQKADGKLTYHLDLPAGYEATVTNQSGLDLVPNSTLHLPSPVRRERGRG